MTKLRSIVDTDRPLIYWSLYDLMRNKEFKKASFQSNSAKIRELLYTVGMDKEFEIEMEDVRHRPRSRKQPWHGGRYKGVERIDAEWKQSGACSLEAYCYSTDSSLMEELLSLDPRSDKADKKQYEDELEVAVDMSYM